MRRCLLPLPLMLLALSLRALADGSVSEELTVGPSALNDGLPFYGNNLTGDVGVTDRWRAKISYLLATDELGTAHQTFLVGPTWDPTEALELGAAVFYSPYASTSVEAQVPFCRGSAVGHTNNSDQLASGSAGAEVNGSYQLGTDRRSLTLLTDLSFTEYQIDQSITPSNCGGSQGSTTPLVYSGFLTQVALNGGIEGRVNDTRFALEATYYLYNQDPQAFGQIRLRGLFPVMLGGFANGLAGIPSEPMAWSLGATAKQLLGEKLRLSFTYGYMQYVGTDGAADVFTPKIGYDFSATIEAYLAYTLQLQFSPTPPGAQLTIGETPPVTNLFIAGLVVSW